jgi:hypothetical protein
LKIAGNWRRLLTSALSEEEIETFRQHERTGRVLGDEDFQKRLEKKLGRILWRQIPQQGVQGTIITVLKLASDRVFAATGAIVTVDLCGCCGDNPRRFFQETGEKA